jgi:hypothetical protein
MTARLLLRITAILIFIHALLHTFGHSGWAKATDAAQQRVITEMTGPKFPFMGVMRSMGNYFDGYGYATTVFLLLVAVVSWIVSGELAGSPSLSKKIVFCLSQSLLAMGILEIIYFFPFAAGITLLATACSFSSWFLLKHKEISRLQS